MAHVHTRIYAQDELIEDFLVALREFPNTTMLDAPVPQHPSMDPPLSELRWKMRMGMSLLDGQLHKYTLVPPLRTRSRPGPHPSIELLPDYEANPAL